MGCGASAQAGGDSTKLNTQPPPAPSTEQPAPWQVARSPTVATVQRGSTNLEAKLPVPIICHAHPLVPYDNGSTDWFCDGKTPACTRDAEGPGPRWRCRICDYDLCGGCVEHYRIKAFCNNGHVLKAYGTLRDNGWNCDGRNDPDGCASGIGTGGVQSSGIDRYRCQICDFDLCEKCWLKRVAGGGKKAEPAAATASASTASPTVTTPAPAAPIAPAASLPIGGTPAPASVVTPAPDSSSRPLTVEKICFKGHKLCPLGTSRDTGWTCDGRFLPGGCKSGITGTRQSAGLNRFRCDNCDYDLCEKCLPSAPDAPTEVVAVDPNREQVVTLRKVPAHWDMSVMKKVPFGLGLRPKDGSNMNQLGRVPLDARVLSGLQEVISASLRKVYTRDRKGGKVPDHLELVRGERVQNAQNWREFVARTENIRAHLERLTTEGSPGVCPNGHTLQPLGLSRDNGIWNCDGRNEEGGCDSSIATPADAKGQNRFRCDVCDYDLCEKCYLMRTGQKLCKVGHVLVPLGTSRDNGWHCDGRDNPGGCKRGLSSQGLSQGINRFRCEECNWDLCDRCHMVHLGHVNSSVADLKTEHHLMERPEFMLDKEPNCVWLFHGTSDQAADCITTGDFLVDKAGSNAGTLYGRGIYLAESCSKADEYTQENEEGLRCLLFCRATLGNVLYNCEAAPNVDRLVRQCVRGTFHSVLGDREKIRGTFREFIVYDDDQVYPEYVLWYRRMYRKR